MARPSSTSASRAATSSGSRRTRSQAPRRVRYTRDDGGSPIAAADRLSQADAIVLSMLCERPMHGYELWAELERREVQAWGGVSKPQVYYSLRKLDAAGEIEVAGDPEAHLGPDRRVYRPTATGRRALADALARPEWAEREHPAPFLTWLVLSWQARPRDLARQIERRRAVLRDKLEFERAALASIIAETSTTSDAAMIVRLSIRQREVELAWLDDVAAR